MSACITENPHWRLPAFEFEAMVAFSSLVYLVFLIDLFIVFDRFGLEYG